MAILETWSVEGSKIARSVEAFSQANLLLFHERALGFPSLKSSIIGRILVRVLNGRLLNIVEFIELWKAKTISSAGFEAMLSSI